MKESYECEVATHTGPESCGAAREGGVEALTRERAGRVFSRVRTSLRDADAVRRCGRPHPVHRYREVLPYVHGVCDRAGLWHTSRYRCTGWGLPHLLTASASRSDVLTRLNARPAHSLVNASTPPSRAAPHDSGPMWVATSHSYDSFIHYTSPV